MGGCASVAPHSTRTMNRHRSRLHGGMADPFANVPISSQPPPQPLDPYKVLRIRPGADEATVRAAYKKRSAETHPDAGGSENDFQVVGAAYEEVKRRMHNERWGTSSGAIGAGLQESHARKQITWVP